MTHPPCGSTQASGFRWEDFLLDDYKHPNDKGFRMMADLAVRLVQRTVMDMHFRRDTERDGLPFLLMLKVQRGPFVAVPRVDCVPTVPQASLLNFVLRLRAPLSESSS